jgi:hypothetical protein
VTDGGSSNCAEADDEADAEDDAPWPGAPEGDADGVTAAGAGEEAVDGAADGAAADGGAADGAAAVASPLTAASALAVDPSEPGSSPGEPVANAETCACASAAMLIATTATQDETVRRI